MLFDDAIARLTRGLSATLPGPTAQSRLAPVPRRPWPSGFTAADLRHAAGLLLMFPRDRHAHIVLTVRAGTLGRHSGQVSLPGGVIDPGESPEQAALREAHEEIALDAARVRVIGALTPLDISVSGFRLHPIVGAVDDPPVLTPSDGEVARILEVALDDLFDPNRLRTGQRFRDGLSLAVPAFHVCGEEIWGATAMVLAEFLAVLGWSPC